MGDAVPAGTTTVFVSLEEYCSWRIRRDFAPAVRLLGQVLRARSRPGLAVVRTDVPLHVHAFRSTTLELMPNAASVRLKRQRSIPLLPQRGLVPRDPMRPREARTVGLKIYRENWPTWLTEHLIHRLSRAGISLRVDTDIDGRWHDFRDIDVSLCPTSTGSSELRKPTTKLVNAWRAATIPVCTKTPSYEELGVEGQDLLWLPDDEEGVHDLLVQLHDDPTLAGTLLDHAADRAADFAPEAVTRLWAQTLRSAPPVHRGGGC